jgi:hypothetical protein
VPLSLAPLALPIRSRDLTQGLSRRDTQTRLRPAVRDGARADVDLDELVNEV